jgi:rSAM/selenodomain-associated transferase 2
MISVVLPTLNAQAGLASALSALVPAVVDGLVREVIVVDAGSTDRTLAIADDAGATIVRFGHANRGAQLAEGARLARQPWLLFLHADTILASGWQSEVAAFIERVDAGKRPQSAAAFRFALDDLGFLPRLLEAGVSVRCMLFRLPYGDQAMLIPRGLYQRVGGYQPLGLMEDVAMVRRLGRRRMVILRTAAVTSAIRYKSDGYVRRTLRNWSCLALYFLHAPTHWIARLYR